VIHAFDNKVHVLPNGKIQGDGLINYSKIGILREDLIFSISYQDDVHEAKELLTTVLAQDDRVLEEPAPRIFVMELNDSSVDIAVRPYVAAEDYWSFQDDIVEAVKFHLENNGFTIPFPQQDIHLYQNSTEASEANREDVNKQ
jgi:small conductance mechanosensitive channel